MPTPSRPSARELFTFQPAADIHWARLAIALWCIVFLSIAAYCIIKPGDDVTPPPHSVSPVYWTAAKQWWAQQDMYGSKEATREGRHGFLYFPQAAVVFSTLAYLPRVAAEILWRLLNLSMVAWAFWRMCKVFADRPLLWFGLGSYIAMPIVALSAQNGQCNLILLALSAHATVDMIQRRWWPATLWICLGLALKPHMLVFILLLSVLEPSMRWRLPIGIIAAASLALLNPDWHYVWQEHIEFIKKMRVAGHPPPGEEQDLVSFLWSIKIGGSRIILSDQTWTILRLIGAAAISLLALLAKLRFDRATALLFVMTLAIQYIMLFNPRTEGPTHAMMAIPMALFTMQELALKRSHARWLLVAACILLGLGHSVIHDNRWLQTTIELAFLTYLAAQILLNRPVFRITEVAPALQAEGLIGNSRG
jgi:hypothetical protein